MIGFSKIQSQIVIVKNWYAYRSLCSITYSHYIVFFLIFVIVCGGLSQQPEVTNFAQFIFIHKNITSCQILRQNTRWYTMRTTTWAKYRHMYIHMWPDLRKPDIMAHTQNFSIKQYKTSVQKTHFIKHLKWTYKGHNLATLTRISKNKAPSCSLSREEYKTLWVVFVF